MHPFKKEGKGKKDSFNCYMECRKQTHTKKAGGGKELEKQFWLSNFLQIPNRLDLAVVRKVGQGLCRCVKLNTDRYAPVPVIIISALLCSASEKFDDHLSI